MNIKMRIIFLVVIGCVLIYVISPLNGLQIRALANGGESSTIGGIPVGDLNEEEIRKVLINEISNWKNEPIVVFGGGNSIKIDTTQIQYNIDESVTQYLAQSSKSWILFWQKKPVVHLPLVVLQNEQIKQQIQGQPSWDTDATYSNVMLNASYLRNHEIEAVVSRFKPIDHERIAVSINEVPGNVHGIQAIVDQLNDVIIQSGEEFSLLTQLDSLLGSASFETINFTASVLYETALKLTAQITERHPHQVLPEYLNPGLDSFVQLSTHKDLRFINTLTQPVQLKLTREGLNLKVEFYAEVVDESATVRVNRDGEVMPRVITRYSNELPIGKSQLIQEGTPGLRVTVYRTNNRTGEEQVVSRDYYAPTNEIVLQSSRQPEISEGGEVAESFSNTEDKNEITSVTKYPGIGEGDSENEGSFTADNGTHGMDMSSAGNMKYDKGGNLIQSGK